MSLMPDLTPLQQTIQFTSDEQGPSSNDKTIYIPPPWRRDRGTLDIDLLVTHELINIYRWLIH